MHKTRMNSTLRRAIIRESYYHMPSVADDAGLLTVLRAGWLDSAPGHTLWRTFCPGDDLIFCVQGRGRVRIRDQQFDMTPGHFAWIPGSAPHGHTADSTNPWSVMWCRIQGPRLDGLRAAVLGAKNYSTNIQDGPSFTQWFKRLFSLIDDRVPRTDLRLNAHISALMDIVARQQVGAFGLLPAPLERVVSAMSAHPGGSWRGNEIEAVAGIGAAQVRRLFNDKIGTTPRKFLREQRILLAQKLLLETNETLQQISVQCGFSDQYHFSREFRFAIGRPPSVWRKIERGR